MQRVGSVTRAAVKPALTGGAEPSKWGADRTIVWLPPAPIQTMGSRIAWIASSVTMVNTLTSSVPPCGPRHSPYSCAPHTNTRLSSERAIEW
jgi:hypothetical protein